MNGYVKTHIDKQDDRDSIICWANDRDDMDGAFHVYDLGLQIVPKGFTLMHLDTQHLLHGSVAPTRSGCRMGLALTNNWADMARAKNQIRENGGEGHVTWTSRWSD